MALVYEKSEQDWRDSRFLANRSRILANGVDVYDMESTLERIRDWSDWCREWCKTAEAHEDRAEKAATSGRSLSAAQFYLRVTLYQEAQKMFDAAKCPKDIWLFDEGNHVCHNLHHIVRPMTADWMWQKLSGATSS